MWFRALLPLSLVPLAGCIGAGSVRAIAPDAGVEVRYGVSAEAVRDALPGALSARKLRVQVNETFDSATAVVIAGRPMSLFSYGTLVRVLVRPVADSGQTSARFVARSRYAFDLSGQVGREVPRTIVALDAALGPAAVGPFPGMEARGRPGAGGRLVRGTVVTTADGARALEPGTEAQGSPIPLGVLDDLAVLRGSFTHRQEGAMVGGLVGLLAGAVIAGTGSSYEERSIAITLGAVAGTLAGALVGTLIRTEVWSQLRL